MPSTEAQDLYPECKGLVRTKPAIVDIPNDADDTFDLLPLYEKIQSDRRTKKHNSLCTNEFLKCRWQSYKDHFSQRIFHPFEFPEVNDYHFYIYHNRLMPQESIKNKESYKKKLGPGPGVDFFGQIPIPNELHLNKGSPVEHKGKAKRGNEAKVIKGKEAKVIKALKVK